MIIDNIDSLTYTVSDNDTENTITVVFSNPAVSEEVGTLRIAKPKAEAFLQSLRTICREIHGVFEDRQKAIVNLDDKLSGTIEF